MSTNIKQYDNSLTRQAEESMTLWTKEVSEMNSWMKKADSAELRDLFNNRELLCTTGFLLRRQIQVKYPDLLVEAQEKSGESYADLLSEKNIPWSDPLVSELAKLLAKRNFSSYDIKITKVNWHKYLTDQSCCNRETAIKLTLAFDMDEVTFFNKRLTVGDIYKIYSAGLQGEDSDLTMFGTQGLVYTYNSNGKATVMGGPNTGIIVIPST